MFQEQMNKIKNLLTKKKKEEVGLTEVEEKGKKRKIENLVFFLVILIITLIVINTILGKDEKSGKEEDNGLKILAEKDHQANISSDDELEKRLEKILETMGGVRKSKCFDYLHTVE